MRVCGRMVRCLHGLRFVHFQFCQLGIITVYLQCIHFNIELTLNSRYTKQDDQCNPASTHCINLQGHYVTQRASPKSD